MWSIPSLGHYLDVLLLLRQWPMLHQEAPGGNVSVLTKSLGQLVGAFVEALQLLQLLPGHLWGEKESREGRTWGQQCPPQVFWLCLSFLHLLWLCPTNLGASALALPSPSCPPGTRCQRCCSRPCARVSARGTAAHPRCPPATGHPPAAPAAGSPACSRSLRSWREQGGEKRA